MKSTSCAILCIAILAQISGHLAAQGPPRRKAYESKCGSEINWIDSYTDAKAAAAASGKPVLWYVPSCFGTPMDRLQELYWQTMGGFFMDEAVIAFINARFVPLRFGFKPLIRRGKGWADSMSRKELQELAQRYKCTRHALIEPGLLFLDKDMNEVHRMDRLSSFNSRWFMARLKRVVKTFDALAFAGVESASELRRPEALAAAHRELAAGKVGAALAAFRKLRQSKAVANEARYFEGVCLHMSGKTSDGDGVWNSLVKSQSNDRWGWKAKLELDRWGPFMRGFEHYVDFPERALAQDALSDTLLPGGEENVGEMTRRSVEMLLSMQREDGGWDDTRYDFGGIDSLPNVYVAITALSAMALMEYRHVDPERVDAALGKARKYLFSERNTNPKDKDEYIWALSYRLLYLGRLLEERPKDAQAIKKKMQELVRLTEQRQDGSGAWRHEYSNPFATASALQALHVARESGAKVKAATIARGAKALAGRRGDDGTFSYSQRGRPGSRPQASGGRMPLCELALVLSGASDMKSLGQALKTSFEQHEHLEKIRKYDNHADRYGNGGFFFWYDVHGRIMAMRAYEGPERRAWFEATRRMILSIHEADGGWLDSFELGKSYGTAMGLICLKLAEAPKE